MYRLYHGPYLSLVLGSMSFGLTRDIDSSSSLSVGLFRHPCKRALSAFCKEVLCTVSVVLQFHHGSRLAYKRIHQNRRGKKPAATDRSVQQKPCDKDNRKGMPN